MFIALSILAFTIAIGLLVAVHEYGHFWVARRSGIKVLRFAIGFGWPLWRWHGKDQVEYVIGSIPLGGYVKMLDEREGDVAKEDLARAFNRQSLKIRSTVAAAGPAANILFAIVAYWLVFVFGISGIKPIIGEIITNTPADKAGFRSGEEIIAVGEESTPTWASVGNAIFIASQRRSQVLVTASGVDGNRVLNLSLYQVDNDPEKAKDMLRQLGIQPKQPLLPAVIGKILPGEPASQAGFQPGDRILLAEGQPIHTWDEWVKFVRDHPNISFNVEVERGSERLILILQPAAVKGENGDSVGRIGAAPSSLGELPEELRATLRYSPLAAVPQAIKKVWEIGSLTVMMIGKMLLGETSTKSISGPITIAEYAGYSAQIGFTSFLNFLAVVSISLGVLNLLPVPVLDGGHLLYNFIELLRGKPLSERSQILGHQMGVVILIGLMCVAFYNDLARLFAQ
ncbi:membrane-associated zinc protein metalloprotease [Candidatus Nitrosoglobus terrae]|uniref:Zinc metalloprotease n=1 Tax=Candidatus Nitrosoglobus terrae TaxID=1630141 RepID=A0A1Q2SLS5_9GAMM|nr:RIP metalloprotease RseP [Candidatus Nitrosoglobus terrae]BAW80088.1 membrane-associated zinc protein metalloprotease [Candidatus Nitrosoglobus terrae]